jgi:hypothetical protein
VRSAGGLAPDREGAGDFDDTGQQRDDADARDGAAGERAGEDRFQGRQRAGEEIPVPEG